MKEIIDEIIRTLNRLASDVLDLRERQPGIRNNYTATAAPGVGDDIDDGYSVGSVWANVNSLPATMYICRDNSAGAAVWTQFSP